MSARRRRTTGEGSDAVRIAETRGVFMISVAAELADMHPQTLRMYEVRGLITPKRSPKGTRLYSQADVERLRKIQRLTTEEGLNLAGVETVLELEDRLQKMRAEVSKLRAEAAEMERQMEAEVERMKRSLRAEIVPYGAYETTELRPRGDGRDQTVKIPVERPTRRRRS
jgi:MerR family transcriptional regulator/heat shock protein HspR